MNKPSHFHVYTSDRGRWKFAGRLPFDENAVEALIERERALTRLKINLAQYQFSFKNASEFVRLKNEKNTYFAAAIGAVALMTTCICKTNQQIAILEQKLNRWV